MTREEPTGINSIDWDKLWQDQMASTSFTGDGVEYWNRMAPHFNGKTGDSNSYMKELLERLKIRPDANLLDIGCGSGSLAIPLSKQVRHVTALDYSPAMLDILKSRIAGQSIDNLTILNLDFLKAAISEIGRHDVVLLSRSLPLRNLQESLYCVDQLALNRCYVTWKAGREESKARICKIAGLEYRPYPDYLIIVNLLFSMGIRSNVELFSSTTELNYASIDDAIKSSLGNHQPDKTAYENLRAYFDERLKIRDDFWYDRRTDTWALIWWKKEDIK